MRTVHSIKCHIIICFHHELSFISASRTGSAWVAPYFLLLDSTFMLKHHLKMKINGRFIRLMLFLFIFSTDLRRLAFWWTELYDFIWLWCIFPAFILTHETKSPNTIFATYNTFHQEPHRIRSKLPEIMDFMCLL